MLIIKIFYLKYLLLFLFDNKTNHFVYINSVLQVKNINKKTKNYKYNYIIDGLIAIELK